MRLRSTGLGNTELEGKITNIEKVGDLVIFHMRTAKPVWHIRVCFQEKDLRKLVGFVLRPKSLLYIIRALFSNQEKVPRTETF